MSSQPAWFGQPRGLTILFLTEMTRTEPTATRKMAIGALIVALAYALLAGVAALTGPGTASWIWLVGPPGPWVHSGAA